MSIKINSKRFRPLVESQYEIVAVDDVQKEATRYLRLKDPFYHPKDKGTLDPRNGGYEFKEGADDVIPEKGSGDEEN